MSDIDDPAVEQLFEKLRGFVAALDPTERELFAALVGPGVALAYRDEDDVEGFALTWEPQRLPDHLAAEVRRRGLRIEGL